jgi:hypothetical protein
MTRKEMNRMDKPNVFLHFVGMSYYSGNNFIYECTQQGFSRRITTWQLEKMNFGDYIFFVTGHKRVRKDVPAEPGKVLGVGYITGIGGLSPDHLRLLREELRIDFSAHTPFLVKRGCGSYMIAGTATMHDDIPTIVNALRKLDINVPLFVNGVFNTNHQAATQVNTHFRRGVYLPLNKYKDLPIQYMYAGEKTFVIDESLFSDHHPYSGSNRGAMIAYTNYARK